MNNASSAPTEQHLKVLRHLAAGHDARDIRDAFAHEWNAVRALFECISAGWVSTGRLTTEGRAVLLENEPVRARKIEVDCRVVERVRVFLAPVEGPAEVVEENR